MPSSRRWSALLLLNLLLCTAPLHAQAPKWLIERVGGSYLRLTTHTQQPAAGSSYTETDTRLVVTRLTDVKLAPNKWSKNPPGYDRPADAPPTRGLGSGLHNGYSRYSNVNLTDRYFIAYGTGQLGCLYRFSDCGLQDILRDHKNKKIMTEYCEVRWDRSQKPDSANWFHYFTDNALHRQNAEQGPASDELIFTLPYPWIHKGDGDWDNSMRYVACAMRESPNIKDPATKKTIKREVDVVGCFDRAEKRLLPGMPRYDLAKTDLNGVDVSPDGKWMTAQTDWYRIEDLRKGVVTPRRGALRGGHGGWAWKDGRSVWVWQESASDYIQYYDPELEKVVQVMPMREIGWAQGMHVGSIKNPALDGWALISTYGPSGGPLTNQLFLLELKPLNKVRHPIYIEHDPKTKSMTPAERKQTLSAALTAWNENWIPQNQRARVWRLGSTATQKYVGGKDVAGYYAEAFASINWDGTMVQWGGNWWATDNLELYHIALPRDWHQKLKE